MAGFRNWEDLGSAATLATQPIYSPLASDPGLRDLLEMFVSTLPQRLQKLHQLAQEQDWEGLRRLAHQLKGAAGSYGYAPLSVTAAQLESVCRHDRDPDQVSSLLSRLEDLACRITTAPPESLARK